MDSGHPTMGEMAYNETSRLERRVASLEKEVKELRKEIEDWSDEVTSAVNRILLELKM